LKKTNKNKLLEELPVLQNLTIKKLYSDMAPISTLVVGVDIISEINID